MPVIVKHESDRILTVEKRTYEWNGGFRFKMIVVDKEDKTAILKRGGFGWAEIDPSLGTSTGMDWIKITAEGTINESDVKRIRMIETPEEFDTIYSLLYERFKSKK